MGLAKDAGSALDFREIGWAEELSAFEKVDD
jgi:hypothetical protein